MTSLALQATNNLPANLADYPYNPFRIAPRKHLAQVQVLEACGMRFETLKVRLLSPDEGRYVRSHFTQKTKNDLWKHLVKEKRRQIRRLYPRITDDKFEHLAGQQIAHFNAMDLHHACQIMTCPIEHSPYETGTGHWNGGARMPITDWLPQTALCMNSCTVFRITRL